jgi:spermidine/putrescine transport system substrate-binding protein
MDPFDAAMASRINRRQLLAGAGALGVGAFLAGCARTIDTVTAGTPTPSLTGSITSETGAVHAYEWAGYDDKALYSEYLAAGYPTPKFSFMTGSQAAIAKTASGYQWDVSHPSTDYLQGFVDIDSLQPWDTKLITHFADLNPSLLKAGQIDGAQYGIVLEWGYQAPLIRTDKVDPNLDSYAYLFSDEAAGRISWFDSPWLLQEAAIARGMDPGQSFEMTASELDDVKKYVIDVGKRNVYNIWVNYQDMWDDVQKGNVWVTDAWPDAYLALKDKVPVKYVRPSGGTLAWTGSMALRSDSKNPFHAHAFADAWASAATAEYVINTFGYGHSNTKVDLSKIDPDVAAAFGLDDPVKNLAEPQTYLARYQPNRSAYARAWDEVKASLG